MFQLNHRNEIANATKDQNAARIVTVIPMGLRGAAMGLLDGAIEVPAVRECVDRVAAGQTEMAKLIVNARNEMADRLVETEQIVIVIPMDLRDAATVLLHVAIEARVVPAVRECVDRVAADQREMAKLIASARNEMVDRLIETEQIVIADLAVTRKSVQAVVRSSSAK